ncbi:hypothetical protein GCM10010896_06370 [Mammaliicoccus stepanovicii]|nr:hypothetical protein GCM10010896_06370 [Mammaliicoccus stepanovicii]
MCGSNASYAYGNFGNSKAINNHPPHLFYILILSRLISDNKQFVYFIFKINFKCYKLLRIIIFIIMIKV